MEKWSSHLREVLEPLFDRLPVLQGGWIANVTAGESIHRQFDGAEFYSTRRQHSGSLNPTRFLAFWSRDEAMTESLLDAINCLAKTPPSQTIRRVDPVNSTHLQSVCRDAGILLPSTMCTVLVWEEQNEKPRVIGPPRLG